jgi:hypothetical protein
MYRTMNLLQWISALSILLTNSLCAALSISLAGQSESARWASLSSANYPGAGGTSAFFRPTVAWPARIVGNGTPSSSATFFKESGGGYFATSSVYDAGVAGTYSLADDSPLNGLQTIVLQLDVGSVIGVAPVLHWNGGQQSMVAQFYAMSSGSYSASSPDGIVASSNHAWQWDLSSVQDPITSYQIVWGSRTNDHLTQFEINVAASNQFTQVVPEPSALLLGLCSIFVCFRRQRK